MKCPSCQAKLLPVDGGLFCLQCGEAVLGGVLGDDPPARPEEATDPLLRRALRDATGGQQVFLGPESLAEARAAPAGMTAAVLAVPPVAVAARPARRRWRMVGWAVALLLVGLPAAASSVLASYYSDRVYPGVRVGGVAVGGWTFDELRSRLPAVVAKPGLVAVIDGRRQSVAVSGPVVDVAATVRQVHDVGRDVPLPAVGMLRTWLAGAVTPTYVLSDSAVNTAVQHLAAAVDRVPSDAVPMMIGGRVIVLADKPGVRLDRTTAAAAIRAAYGRSPTVSLSLVRLNATVTASDYAGELAAAQAIVSGGAQVVVKAVHYAATPEQVGSWVVFAGAGKGVTVDPAGVAAFVAGIKPAFDRVAAVNAMVAALNARQAALVTASTRRITAAPKLASGLGAGPVATYSYCVDAVASGAELASSAAAVLGTEGWTLGGRVRFVAAASGCNVALELAPAADLTALDPACEHQTTCRIHNELAIAQTAWAKPPAAWSGSAASYRVELINQVVGQWLGFDHPSCGQAGSQVPVLSAPSVVVAGCSPVWYAVPAELQDSKVLPGF